jgi:transcriptional regulator with XRE-family HTH domain
MEPESLGTFLKTRRSRVTPDLVELSATISTRRVPGLRREELAQLAGVSVGYYTRLEQDQAGSASQQVLNAIARVLRLGAAERTHLHNLARHSNTPRIARPAPEQLDGRVMALLESLRETIPAVILGRRGDVLAWNHAGHELMAEHVDFDAPEDVHNRPSIPRLFFLDSLTRDLYRNWDELARIHVAYLRLTSGRYPQDGRLVELIGELTMRSDEFASMWATGDVADCTVGRMDLHHPTIGPVDVNYQVWVQPESPDHRLEVYTPNDAKSQDALRLLPDRFDVSRLNRAHNSFQ